MGRNGLKFRHLNGRSDNAIKNWWNGGANRRRRASLATTTSSNNSNSNNGLHKAYEQVAQQQEQQQQEQQHQEQYLNLTSPSEGEVKPKLHRLYHNLLNLNNSSLNRCNLATRLLPWGYHPAYPA